MGQCPYAMHRFDRTLDVERLPDHLDRLYRVARAITGSAHEAEDLVSETLVRVLARPRSIQRQDELGYLIRALRNTWADTLRTRSRRPATTAMPEDTEYEDARAGRRPHASAEAREVLAAVGRLPGAFRDVVLMVDVAGLSYAEAADALGIPKGTVMSRLSRGRDAVAAELGPIAA